VKPNQGSGRGVGTRLASGRWRELLLLAGVIVQAGIVGVRYALPLAAKIVDLRRRSAVYRAAAIMRGERLAEFVEFLQSTVPSDPSSKVILPPRSLPSDFTHIGFMQYFLFPRRIDNCHDPVEPCVLNLTGEHTYILAVDGFPPPDTARTLKDYIAFDSEWGV